MKPLKIKDTTEAHIENKITQKLNINFQQNLITVLPKYFSI